ncbi:CMP-sialic acid transporter 2 [Capsicum baccatum]|uniref:CMP-sialic acid transporter 2 n=1 Tax=Capsicum baccatum TaxID=33114 RepID=A0A2G2X634_CAPBA|nr:CMP-sialic acid transporter 2 [Capsicum baccatum]
MSKVDGKFKFNPVSANFLTEATKVVFAIIMLLIQAARNNVLLAVPELLDAINNYLKFIMQVLVIAVLLKLIMNRRFSLIQWEALAIGISISQLRSLPEGATSLALPVTTIAYIYTLIFNLFLYGYGAIFNFLAILGISVFKVSHVMRYRFRHQEAKLTMLALSDSNYGE